jgi:transposase
MKGFHLTPQQLAELRQAHRSESNKRAAYKINAVILLGTGWKLKQVREALLLDDETLRSYVKLYQEEGIDGLVRTHHAGSQPYLTAMQTEILINELDSSIHLSTKSVISFVENKFNIIFSLSGMRDFLHRIGYEYKKPKLVPGNPDEEAQELFAEQYEEFMLNKPANIEVLFVDAVHPEHNGMAAYGWIKRGEKRKLKTNSGRQRLNLHGALNAETLEVTIIESKTIDAESTLTLLETIEQKYPLSSQIFVILDNAKYHYSKEVRSFVEKSKIKLVFLPSYSPNLNLIERLWKFFKKKVIYNSYYENLDLFRKSCIEFFKNIDDHHEELIVLMSHDFELT